LNSDIMRCFLRRNSLLPPKKSLFLEIFSLLIFAGNCPRSGCSTAASCYEIASRSPNNAKFPVKFPVSREFAWRRVRSALRRQPGSPGAGETSRDSDRKAHQWRAFAIWWTVSTLPISPTEGRIRRKSPATTANIPVFGRLTPETGFDRHCVAVAAVQLVVC
jgi:hypothetical protein